MCLQIMEFGGKDFVLNPTAPKPKIQVKTC